jgi:hypothetical protein
VQAGGATKDVTATFAHEPPAAFTDPGATFVGQHVATVHGSIDPNGADVSDCVVEYGPGTSYGLSAPCVPSAVGSGDSPVPVGADLIGLSPSTVYHYRFGGSNIGGSARGADQTFRTLADSCDTNEALCVTKAPQPEPRPRCRKPRVQRKGRCVRKHNHHHRRHRSGKRGARR